jgi:hypothetical protein
MNFKPDRHQVMTVSEAVEELVFSGPGWFYGPGWYHSAGDTMLVIPVDRPMEELWHQKWSWDERFEFNVWRGRNPAEWFNRVANAPTRE